MSLLLLLSTLIECLVHVSQIMSLLQPVGREIFLLLLRRVGLSWQVVRSVVLKQDQASNLIRLMKTDIWILRLIQHWQIRILGQRGTSYSIVVIFLPDFSVKKIKEQYFRWLLVKFDNGKLEESAVMQGRIRKYV